MNASHYHGVDHYVGNTPLIRLRRLSELTRCEILGKAEFMDPGGSVKDRAALGIIEDAETRGALEAGATIGEGTAGNTGIGLAMVGQAKGYRTVIVIPETQSVEKITLLRTLGAQVITVPEKPYSDPGNYNRQAQRPASWPRSGQAAPWLAHPCFSRNRARKSKPFAPILMEQRCIPGLN